MSRRVGGCTAERSPSAWVGARVVVQASRASWRALGWAPRWRQDTRWQLLTHRLGWEKVGRTLMFFTGIMVQVVWAMPATARLLPVCPSPALSWEHWEGQDCGFPWWVPPSPTACCLHFQSGCALGDAAEDGSWVHEAGVPWACCRSLPRHPARSWGSF